MRVITVARKPLAGTVAQTALKFGTGGINIDATRIGLNPGYKYNADRNGTTFHGQVGERIRQTADKKGAETIEFTKGRWPANLILQHLTGCRCVGEKKISAPKHRNPSDGGSKFCHGDVMLRPDRTMYDQTDDNGKETVADWKHVSGCPVAALDEQSGVLQNGTVKSGYMKNSSSQLSDGGFMISFEDVPLTGFGDSGGASRFFKQVQSRDSECE